MQEVTKQSSATNSFEKEMQEMLQKLKLETDETEELLKKRQDRSIYLTCEVPLDHEDTSSHIEFVSCMKKLGNL